MSYCDWDKASELCRLYHDEEWGVPVQDDKKQLEFLMLEAMQFALSWNLMIQKREVFRKCFDGFDYDKIALYTEADVDRILNTDGMIRSPRTVSAVINNARCFQKIRAEYGSFCAYLWGHSDGKTILYDKHADGFIPVSNGLSDRIAKDLKKRGFKYLGSITVYSHLQACGIINDHDKDCPKYSLINASHPTIRKKRDAEKQVTHFK